MKYGININYFRNTEFSKAAELISKAGFTCLDYTPPIAKDDWQDIMKNACKVFAEYGLKVTQTHIPFNRYGSCSDNHRLYVDRVLEATAFMGAEHAVVHGDEFDFDNMQYSPETALEYNHNYFAKDVEFAEKSGFKMAFETVFNDHPVRTRFSSNPEELLDLINSFNSKYAVCCWDFGHANVSFRKTAHEWIVKFGSLIECTHVHDNAGNDSHQMPLTGDIDWKQTMAAFKEIGYDKVMSIEYAHGSIPEHMICDYINLTYKALDHLCNL